MESLANSVEDYLIEGLSFKLRPGASYVTNRRNVTWYASGAQSYVSGTGARVIRLQINGDGWVDPSTIRFVYTLNNLDQRGDRYLRTIGGPWSFFRRARCIYQGAIVDDIDQYHRTHEMFSILTSQANRDDADIEGFGWRWDDDVHYTPNGPALAQDNTRSIPTNSSKTVSFKPLLGLFNQSKYIPLMWGSLVLEYEIVTNATDSIASLSGADFSDANTSQLWSISDVRLVGDIVTLDSALQNSYAEHVLSGKALPINYNTFITLSQSIAGSTVAVNVSRSVSRLKTLFVSFDGPPPPTPAAKTTAAIIKEWNRFYHPMAAPPAGTLDDAVKSARLTAVGYFDFNRELEYQVQIGSKMIPEYPCRSLAQAFYELKKSLGIHGSAWHSISPSFKSYCKDHFIIGIDCEKVLEAGWTGLNTKAGDLLTIKVKGANGNIASDQMPVKLFVTLNSDQILEIRDSGATVFD